MMSQMRSDGRLATSCVRTSSPHRVCGDRVLLSCIQWLSPCCKVKAHSMLIWKECSLHQPASTDSIWKLVHQMNNQFYNLTLPVKGLQSPTTLRYCSCHLRHSMQAVMTTNAFHLADVLGTRSLHEAHPHALSGGPEVLLLRSASENTGRFQDA